MAVADGENIRQSMYIKYFFCVAITNGQNSVYSSKPLANENKAWMLSEPNEDRQQGIVTAADSRGILNWPTAGLASMECLKTSI